MRFERSAKNAGLLQAFLCSLRTRKDTLCQQRKNRRIEACGAFGVAPYRADGTLNCENVIYAMRTMAENGVSDKVIVHSKFDSFILKSF